MLNGTAMVIVFEGYFLIVNGLTQKYEQNNRIWRVE